MTILVIIAVVLAVIPLLLILGDVFMRGAPALSIGFLTHLPTAPNVPGGGIANAIVGNFHDGGYSRFNLCSNRYWGRNLFFRMVQL